jgi:hypothetical protein
MAGTMAEASMPTAAEVDFTVAGDSMAIVKTGLA